MATRNFVPRNTNEGTIGTSDKVWSGLYVNTIYGPNLTGVPTTTTPETLTNTKQIANTIFVNNAVSSHNSNNMAHANIFSTKANLASPSFTGTPTVPDVTAGNNSQIIANTKFVTTAISNYNASLASNFVPTSGGVINKGSLTIQNSNASKINGDANPALALGTKTSQHLELDTTSINSKVDGNSTSDLLLQQYGGSLYLGLAKDKSTSSKVYAPTVTVTTSSDIVATTAFVHSVVNNLTSSTGSLYLSTVSGGTVYAPTIFNSSNTIESLHTGENISNPPTPPLVIGGNASGVHIEIDKTDINAATNNFNAGTMYIQRYGGELWLGLKDADKTETEVYAPNYSVLPYLVQDSITANFLYEMNSTSETDKANWENILKSTQDRKASIDAKNSQAYDCLIVTMASMEQLWNASLHRISLKADINNPTFTGTVTIPTLTVNNSATIPTLTVSTKLNIPGGYIYITN